MLARRLVFVALLVLSSGQSGIPQDINDLWAIAAENLQDDDTDGKILTIEERIWPESSLKAAGLVTERYQSLLTTTEPYLMKEQDSKEAVGESAVWKIVLVAAILLVSIVGSLSMAYYLCVWRGGRINYQVQKEVVAEV